ncbi:Error-prone repair protein ImuA [Sphingobacterium sp. DK4209]|uniref:Error-prone repair protein ImuA n=1 Tax=Sphingobacterium zhuxiongii TaxID=2662364 RepID=A0A5Q0Q8Z1_9SPHI|nr:MULTISPECIES: Error-prone repair protein ImuA [unclassified Sphingobacterium]MVZ64239.1 Error-prone repair protein ImuA [Sphingobacterium sp. DK4209]QGA25589.1 Error-prone repair protein ImuA [Sphingobacterium sp. dk4302]
MMVEDRQALISKLKNDMLLWQGIKPRDSQEERLGLGPIEEAFPNGIFPKGSIHEFISTGREEGAASCGFMSALLSKLMKSKGVCLWISSFKSLFPIAIKTFGVEPERVVIVCMQKEKDVLWAMEEALKCPGISGVVAEVHKLDYTQTRRLQLAVEKSQVVGFILRHNPKTLVATACTARWRIKPLASYAADGLPGIGFPRWDVELLKVRNGNPGRWQVEFSTQGIRPIFQQAEPAIFSERTQQTG